MKGDVSAKVVCTARSLIRSSRCIEEELKKTLDRCDLISEDLCKVVAKTLTKLCSDLSGAPLVLHQLNDDPQYLSRSLRMLDQILSLVQPESLSTEIQLQQTLERLPSVCPDGTMLEMARILIQETFFCFQRFRNLFATFVQKDRNAQILLDRVLHFFQRCRSKLSQLTFSLLKLSVCLRAEAEGCFSLTDQDRLRVGRALREASLHSRTFAAIMQPHRDLFASCLEAVSGRRPTWTSY